MRSPKQGFPNAESTASARTGESVFFVKATIADDSIDDCAICDEVDSTKRQVTLNASFTGESHSRNAQLRLQLQISQKPSP